MPDWTLTHDATTQTFEAWGMSNVVIRERNQSAGTLTADMAGDAWADLPFAYEDEVIVKLGETVKWRGYFIRPHRRVGEAGEIISLEFRDAWHWLETVTFLRSVPALVPVNTTLVELFAAVVPGVSWSRRSVNDELSAVCTFAGVGISTLPLGGTMQPPPVEMRSPMCADVVKACLRKLPDTVTRIEHGAEYSTIYFRQRPQGTSRSLALDGSTVIVDKSILPRHDIQVRGVVITWVIETAEGEITSTEDTAGLTSGSRVLRDTIALRPPQAGAAGVTESVEVESETISITDSAFWMEYGGLDPNVLDVAVEAAVKEGTSFSKVFLGGMIPRWLDEADHLQEATIHAKLAYKVAADPEDTGKNYAVVRETKTIKVMMTDLSGPYSRTVVAAGDAIAGDEPINGLAASVYASLSTLQYEGAVKLVENEIAGVVRCGDLLNLTSGRTEWAAMNAQVHGVSWHLDTGSTVLDFGPSGHLTPSELADLQFAMRREASKVGQAQRSTPMAASDGGDVKGGKPRAATKPPAGVPIPKEFHTEDGGWEFSWAALDGLMKMESGDGSKALDISVSEGFLKLKDGSKLLTLKPGEITIADGTKTVTLDFTGLVITDPATGTLSAKLDDMTGFKYENAAGDSIAANMSAAFKLTKTSGDIAECSLTQVGVIKASGDAAKLTPEGGLTHTLAAGGNLTSSAQDGFEASDGTATVEAKFGAGFSHDDGTGTATLDAAGGLEVSDGTNTATVTGADGFNHEEGGYSASLGGDAGLVLSGDGGTVTLITQSGKDILLQETEMCVDDGGTPAIKSAFFLRGTPE